MEAIVSGDGLQKCVPLTQNRKQLFLVRPSLLSNVVDFFELGRFSQFFGGGHAWKINIFLNVHTNAHVPRKTTEHMRRSLGYTVEQERRVSAKKLTFFLNKNGKHMWTKRRYSLQYFPFSAHKKSQETHTYTCVPNVRNVSLDLRFEVRSRERAAENQR